MVFNIFKTTFSKNIYIFKRVSKIPIGLYHMKALYIGPFVVLKKKKNSEIGATLGQTKAAYKNGEIGEKVHGLVLESNFSFLCHLQVGVLFFFFFFSLCQGVTRGDYICKNILGVKGGRCPFLPPSGSALGLNPYSV